MPKMDITGEVFGEKEFQIQALYEIEPYISPSGKSKARRWMCKCFCDNKFAAKASELRSGKIISCGCKKRRVGRHCHDLSGQRFGNEEYYVEALYEIDPYITSNGVPLTRYRYKCKCGKEFNATASEVKRGKITSCGCRRKDGLSGKKIGTDEAWIEPLYIARYDVDVRGEAYAVWRCRCKCGKEFDRPRKSIKAKVRNGGPTSCGCHLDMIGKRFGTNDAFVDVIGEAEPYISPSGHTSVRLRCRCKCGNAFSTLRESIVSGRTSSCGCLKSRGEAKIMHVLSMLNVDFSSQKTFESCRNPKTNAKLIYDFSINDDNLILEFDGEQHNKATGGWYKKQQQLDLMARDAIKNDWCRENNKQLIRIPYTELSYINAAYMLTLMRLAAMEEDEELVCPA